MRPVKRRVHAEYYMLNIPPRQRAHIHTHTRARALTAIPLITRQRRRWRRRSRWRRHATAQTHTHTQAQYMRCRTRLRPQLIGLICMRLHSSPAHFARCLPDDRLDDDDDRRISLACNYDRNKILYMHICASAAPPPLSRARHSCCHYQNMVL